MTLDPRALNTYAENAHKLQGGGFSGFILRTSFDALARNEVLQVLFFAIVFGIRLALVGSEAGACVTRLIEALSTV
ncbi:C4-dicarboxylate transport protein [Methylobacterium marchantiae]|nr:C4-dicarboxylate transport protein [Methylobacterium marchantiae]